MANNKKTRRSISPKTRFEVFKRDDFICQYCGRDRNITTLEVDHILPVSKGGTNSFENLTTSCIDCNRGKRDNTLDKGINAIQRVIKPREFMVHMVIFNFKFRKAMEEWYENESELNILGFIGGHVCKYLIYRVNYLIQLSQLENIFVFYKHDSNNFNTTEMKLIDEIISTNYDFSFIKRSKREKSNLAMIFKKPEQISDFFLRFEKDLLKKIKSAGIHKVEKYIKEMEQQFTMQLVFCLGNEYIPKIKKIEQKAREKGLDYEIEISYGRSIPSTSKYRVEISLLKDGDVELTGEFTRSIFENNLEEKIKDNQLGLLNFLKRCHREIERSEENVFRLEWNKL